MSDWPGWTRGDRVRTDRGLYVLDREHTRGEGWFYTLLWYPQPSERPTIVGNGINEFARTAGTAQACRRLARKHYLEQVPA